MSTKQSTSTEASEARKVEDTFQKLDNDLMAVEKGEADIASLSFDVDDLVAKLSSLHASKKETQVARDAQILQRALVTTKDFANLKKLLALQATWSDDTPAFGLQAARMLKMSTKDRLVTAKLECCKFGVAKPSESFRRLDILLGMQQGAYYFNKDWGFGIVKRVDAFCKRVVVDFTDTPNHSMSMDYAAEILAPIGKDHILAKLHDDPAGIAALVASKPGEIVRMAITDFGPLSIVRLEETLAKYGIVAEKNWKTFWTAARADIKDDKRVVIPAKRSEAISIRESALEYDDSWFADELAEERNIPRLFEVISAYESAGRKEISEESRKILTDRLNFAIDGAFIYPPPMFTRLVLMAQRLKIDTPREELCVKILNDNRYMEAGDKLSSNESKELVSFIVEVRPDAVGGLLANLDKMSFNLTSQTLDVLRAKPEFLSAAQARCRELLVSTSVPSALLVWTIRSWDELKDWGLPSRYEIMERAIAVIESQMLAGEQLRMQHLLLSCFKDAKWFNAWFTALDKLQREALFFRICGNNNVGEPATQRKLVAEMIEIEPALESKKVTKKTVAKPVLRVTSWKMLHKKQEDLKHLIEVDIPKNRDDIEYARSLGDLRENSEYQTARQKQAVLNARRQELTLDIANVQGTDFANEDTSVVAMGTMVTLAYADETEKTFTILGEFDSDETLSIISNRSLLAKNLAGKHAGETAVVPTAIGGEETVTVKAINVLDARIRAWLADDAAQEGTAK